jgi:hypothetical protein
MKDKVCSDFVFMPLKGEQRVPPMASGGGATVAPAERLTATPAMVDTSSGHTEVKSKIIVVGDCQCGKTTLIHRYINSKFQEVSFSQDKFCINSFSCFFFNFLLFNFSSILFSLSFLFVFLFFSLLSCSVLFCSVLLFYFCFFLLYCFLFFSVLSFFNSL